MKKRADDVLAGLTATVGKAAEIQTIQAAGLADMTQGLASNSKACKDSLNECSETGAKYKIPTGQILSLTEHHLRRDFWNGESMHSELSATICYCTGEAGLTQFRNGIKTVDGAEEKFSKLKDDVVAYLRSVIPIFRVNCTIQYVLVKKI